MLPREVETILSSGDEARFEAALERIATAFEAQTATLHRADAASRLLHLVSSRGLPEPVIAVTRTIEFGKGMAGICADRREFVTTCNLQTDDSGVVRAGARQTGVAGAIVTPIFAPDGSLVGTLGVGKRGEHDYTDSERETLAACARAFASAFASDT